MTAIGIRDEQALNNATVVVGTFDSPTYNNDGRAIWSLVVRQGGGGVLTMSVMVSTDGINFVQAGPALAAVTIGTAQRTVYAVGSTQGPLVEPFIKVRAVVTGSSATGVFADLLGLSTN